MGMHPVIEVYRSTTELEQKTAERIVHMINKAIEARGVCFIVLSGGETPRPVYRLLGTAPMKDSVDWNCVHLFFTDERAVPPADYQSNYGMVNRELFSRIDILPKNVHRIEGEKKPELAAADYERELREIFRNQIMRFDMVLLGLGEDGHIASIFPGTETVRKEEGLVCAVYVPRLRSWRVTLTFKSINNTREALFLVSGKKKASIVQRILKEPRPNEELPATMVRPEDGKLLWMLDEDAAGEYEKL